MDMTETSDAIEAPRLILDQVRDQLIESGWSNGKVRTTTGLRSIKVAMLDRIKEGDLTPIVVVFLNSPLGRALAAVRVATDLHFRIVAPDVSR